MSVLHPYTPPGPVRALHRPRDWAVAAGVALALHVLWLADGLALTAWRRSEPAPPAAVPAARPVLTVRRVDPRPPPPVVPVVPARAPDRPTTAVARAPASPPRVEPAAVADTAPPAPAVETLAASEGDPPPTYRTRLPPSFRRVYALARGGLSGQAELSFEADAEGYRLALRSELPDRPELALLSRGRLDTHGLAPERFAEARRGRERLAAHFDRASARISYSGPQMRHALLPGGQDRLSWLVQLPAVLAADPEAGRPGATIQLPVSGTRGDAGVWTFVVQDGASPEPAGAASRPVLHLVREPARPYDTRAEVWLDPADHYLPLRVRLTHPPAGAGFELRLAEPAPDHPDPSGP